VDQVKDLGLPSTPLKETEKRASGWRSRYGVEQTEIDALATLRPETLREIVRTAIGPYFDKTLESRVRTARWQWLDYANERLNEALDSGEVSDIYAEVTHHLEGLSDAVERLGDVVNRIDLDLPPIALPAVIVSEPPAPLVSSDMDLHAAIRVLRERKDYVTR
jgi:hypothetical protein